MYINSTEYLNDLDRLIEPQSEIFLPFNGKVILVTGAAGLLATFFIDIAMRLNAYYGGDISILAVDRNGEALKERYESYLSSGKIELICGDVNDSQFVSKLSVKNFDYVLHAASNTSPVEYGADPVGTINTNVIGTYNLLELIKNRSGVRFLFCSSVEMYGANRGDVEDFNEDYSGYVDANTVRAAYPSGKRAAESMCRAYMSQYGIDYVIARIGRFFGPTVVLGDTKAPTQFMMNGVKNEDIVLKSDGSQLFSWGYAGDCATGFYWMFVKGLSGEAYNIADPNGKLHLREFAQFIADAAGTKCVFAQRSDAEEKGYSKITHATLDTSKLTKLGWRAQFDIKGAIEKTLNYLRIKV